MIVGRLVLALGILAKLFIFSQASSELIDVGTQVSASLHVCRAKVSVDPLELPVRGDTVSPVIVIPFPPSKEEIRQWQSLPATITSANHLLGYSHRSLRWGNLTSQVMWQLPLNHKRQNKAYCSNLSQRVSREHTIQGLDLYKSNTSIVKATTFYVVQMREVVIQDLGVVVGQCENGKGAPAIGYYQPTASCETFYKFIGRKFVLDCMRNLTSHSIKWPDLMADTVHHGRTCFPQDVVDAGWANKRKKKDESGNIRPARPRITRDAHVVKYDEVWVATTGWDNNYHHFVIDCLARLARHLDWLKAHPTVKIHMRHFEKMAKKDQFIAGGKLLRAGFWDLVGIDENRIISGPAAARVAWIPRESTCNDPLKMGFEIRLLADTLKRLANERIAQRIDNSQKSKGRRRLRGKKGKKRRRGERRKELAMDTNTASTAHDDDYIDDDGLERNKDKDKDKEKGIAATSSSRKRRTARDTSKEPLPGILQEALRATGPVLVVQQRSCSDWAECVKTWRLWNDTTADIVMQSFEASFPGHTVLLLSDTNKDMTECIACQIALYQRTNVLVGIHGAGITNIMFMPPDSLLVEVTGEFDGRMAPVCGYHGPLAAAYGVHHYLWLWQWKYNARSKPVYPSKEQYHSLAREAKEFHASLDKTRNRGTERGRS